MLIGYNTNVPYKGIMYHVQTEDSGLKSPVIITLLYLKGTILASKKTGYAHLVDDPDYKEKVREIMKEQHKAMLKELISGRYTGEAGPLPVLENEPTAPKDERVVTAQPEDKPVKQPEPKRQIAKSLDDILLDYILKGSK